MLSETAPTDDPAQARTLRELVGAYVEEQCRALLDADASHLGGVDAIHKTRVASRRLRSTLRTFFELFEVPRAGRLDDELRWWAGVLGEVRDLDVLEERLTASLDDLPDELVLGRVRAQLAETLAGRRRRARAALDEAMESARYGELVGLLNAWHVDPPFTGEADRPAKKVGRFLRRADKKVVKRLRTGHAAALAGAPDADVLLHRARKAGKRHRYAAELVEPLWGAKATRVVERRKDLQELLGDHQDSVVARTLLRDLGAAATNGFTWGLLYAREEHVGARTVVELQPYL